LKKINRKIKKIKRGIKDDLLSNFIVRKIWSIFSRINQKPLFILGNFKSGTTIIANLLSKATKQTLTSDIHSAIKHATLQLDFNILNCDDFIKQHKYEFSKEIIKEPFLSFYTEELITSFPNAKFIWIVRNPYQNIRSILNRLKIPGNLPKINFNNFAELEKNPAWKLNLQSKMFGYNSSNYIEALAFRWNYAINIYKQNIDKIILVKYEDFIIDKKKYIDGLALDLGFTIQTDISNYVNIQYQSKGNAEIDLKEFFGKKNYKIIDRLCKENMKELGY
jgi:hypothetical protein